MSLANWITLARFPLLVLLVLIIYFGDAMGRFLAVPGVLLLIVLDAVDGIVARRRGETTFLGSVLDIAADRAVEIVLWVIFANLSLISLVIPITFIIRGALTDSVREIGYAGGKTAHDQVHSDWGYWLVAGRPMRAGYGLVKAVAFALLALTLALQSANSPWLQPVWVTATALSWIATLLCIIRGVPVVVEAFRWEGKRAA
ncbi:MAG: CDP-alcohol phosphatidyltransferase family protein [Caldilinea sp.]